VEDLAAILRGVHDHHCSTAPRRDRGGNAILNFSAAFHSAVLRVPNQIQIIGEVRVNGKPLSNFITSVSS
jgi:hypothetical protein